MFGRPGCDRRGPGLLVMALVVTAVAVATSAAAPRPTVAVGQAGPLIAGGTRHSLVVRPDGSLWTFGDNVFGELGNERNDAARWNPEPTRVMSDVASVAAGMYNSFAVKTDRTLWAFGQNGAGQLGFPRDGIDDDRNPSPTQVMTDVASVATGWFHTMVVRTDGTMWGFGSNGEGQLGAAPSGSVPTQLMSGVAAVAAGMLHSLVLKTDGTLWTMGDDTGGQLGNGPGENSALSQVMTGVSAVAAGYGFSLALGADGTLWGFGSNGSGQLGFPSTGNGPEAINRVEVPIRVMTGVKAIAAGGSTTLALRTDGTLWEIGANDTPLGQPDPVRVLSDVSAIAGGGSHRLAITGDGKVWSWGFNSNGQLGLLFNPSSGWIPQPTEVPFDPTGHRTVDGQYEATGVLPAGRVTELRVTRRHGVPADAVAVTLNVTVAEAQREGFLTVWPCGAPMPTASNVNFRPGDTVANTALVKVGAEGSVCLYSDSTNHVIVDIGGYHPVGSPYVGLVPARLMDSRPGASTFDEQFQGTGVLRARSVVELQVAGRHQVPFNAGAVALNVTVTDARGSGFVTVWPCGASMPNASNLNYTPGATVANTVITKLGTNGTVCLYTEADIHLITDINGYFSASSTYSPLVPARLMDSRPGASTIDEQFQGAGRVGARSVVELQVAGRHQVPFNAGAVALNVTVTDARGSGFVTVWPCGASMPNASNLNYTPGATVANTVITKLGTNGTVCLYTEADIHLITDINGYFWASSTYAPLVPGRLMDTR